MVTLWAGDICGDERCRALVWGGYVVVGMAEEAGRRCARSVAVGSFFISLPIEWWVDVVWLTTCQGGGASAELADGTNWEYTLAGAWSACV